MAGAISAGAYTAGVMDFLIEALDAFEAAKKDPAWDGPTHDVRVPMMAGASAGGMTAAMSAVQAFQPMDHARESAPPPAQSANSLYANWVQRIDLKPLLATTDLDGAKAAAGVTSALCSDVLDMIVAKTFTMGPVVRERAWIGRGDNHSLRVLMTVTNLRGVPYAFTIQGAASVPYAMVNHGDYLDFTIGKAPAPVAGSYPLDVADTTGPNWALFGTVAMATGAFPVGLAPRPIERKVADYDVSLRVGRDTPAGFQTIAPNDIVRDCDPFRFVAVDGGTIDNEPLEIGRRLLSQSGKLEDDGIKANKAIILIAPFPNYLQLPPENAKRRLVDVVPQLSTTLIQQSRFKPDELSKAANDTVFSRFLIAPSRDGAAAKRYPIACGVLNGFGGFIDESFRRHDYLLGRRNAQAFLRVHFALPEDNPLFDDVANKEKWHIVDLGDQVRGGATKSFAAVRDAPKDQPGLPIIPLCGALAKEIVIGPADQPQPGTVDRADLGKRIDRRMGAVVAALVDYDLRSLTRDMLSGWVMRKAAKFYLGSIASKKFRDKVDAAIDDVAAAFPKPPVG